MNTPQIKPGDKILLVAPSGAGKSTLVSKILKQQSLFSFNTKHVYVIGPGANQGSAAMDPSEIIYLKTPPIWNSIPPKSVVVTEDVQLWAKTDLEALKHLFLSAANHQQLVVFCTLQSSTSGTNQAFWRIIQDNATHLIIFRSISNIALMRRVSKLLGHSPNFIQECMKHVTSINRPHLLVDLENTVPFQIRTLGTDGSKLAFAPNNWLQ